MAVLQEVGHHPNRVYVGQDGNLYLNGALVTSTDLLWGNCPLIGARLDPTLAFIYDEEFNNYDATATTGDWTLTQVTGGTAAVSTTVPGALLVDPGDSTAHHGVNLQRLKCAFVPAAGKSLWFECTVILGTGLTCELFFGLSGSLTGIIASGSLVTTGSLMGFSSVTGDGVMLFNSVKATVANTPPASPVTLSITVPHSLGFFYDGVADTLQAFVDTANIPKVVVYPSIVVQSSGTTESTATISGLRVVQLR